MKSINTLMVAAIATRTDWQAGQTRVRHDKSHSETVVTFRGRIIAIIKIDSPITISLGGHDSATVRSRLNAILAIFMPLGWRVFKWENLTYLIRRHDPGRFAIRSNQTITMALTGQLINVGS